MKTSDKIIKFIKERPKTVSELSNHLNVSRQLIHRHLKKLVDDNVIEKIGKTPRVFYSTIKKNSVSQKNEGFYIDNFNKEETEIIENNFMFIKPSGQKLVGFKAFVIWCEERNLNLERMVKEYVKIFKKYNKLKKDGLVNGTTKIKKTFDKQCINKIFYIDFYSWEIFGKTKLGQLLLLAKQSQNKKMIKEIIEIVAPRIEGLIKKENIEAIGFIPPTVKREVQFMKVLEHSLRFSTPKLRIEKINRMVPQKTLSKLKDRIENANDTIIVRENSKYKKILLIDDAVGSGATLNQTACKIKKQKISNNVIGLSLAGSLKGFNVISEI